MQIISIETCQKKKNKYKENKEKINMDKYHNKRGNKSWLIYC